MMRTFLACWGCLCLVAGCSSKKDAVTLFAAASTQEAVEAIGRDFEAETGIPVSVSPSASSWLARQIAEGAGADLFLSADEKWADFLEEHGLVARRRNLLGNRLVVVTNPEAKLELKELDDLAQTGVRRLALAGEEVPAGAYAREALKKAGVWDRVQKRVLEGGDVRQTLAYVQRGEAEAGIVYATDAAMADGKVRVAFTVPEALHKPIRYPLVLVRRDRIDARAERFYQFLEGETAAARFRRAGFEIVR